LNILQSGIIVIFLIIITGISAGCTGSVPPASSDTTPQITVAATETNQTPTTAIVAEAMTNPTAVSISKPDGELKPGDKVNSTDVFSRNYSWCEYQENVTSEMPPNGIVQRIYFSRIERTIDDYNGAPAIHYKSISEGKGWNVISNHYIDTSINNQLGGTIINTRDGKIDSIENYTAEPLNQENRPFGEKIHTFVYQCTESVTVPAGTFPEARKYIHYNPDNTVGCTYWFAPDIPVPVLYQYSN
jgi:hypothetical protein